MVCFFIAIHRIGIVPQYKVSKKRGEKHLEKKKVNHPVKVICKIKIKPQVAEEEHKEAENKCAVNTQDHACRSVAMFTIGMVLVNMGEGIKPHDHYSRQ